MCCDNSSSKDFRRYDAAWWVRTEVDGGDLDNAGNIGKKNKQNKTNQT